MHALLLTLLSTAIPPLTGPVVDDAGLLSPADAERIAAGLRSYHDQTGNQLQVLIIRSLPEGTPIEEYSIRVAEEWKLGTAKEDNGVLLVLSAQDRKWRIEVGGGLEGELTDIDASRIGRETLVPAFRQGQYASGIAATLQAIAGQLGGRINFQGVPPVSAPRQAPPRTSILPLLFFALLILMLGRRRRGGFLTGMILGSMVGRGGWGGGGRGGGGGGGWGGGGGGFSGGGAGGSW